MNTASPGATRASSVAKAWPHACQTQTGIAPQDDVAVGNAHVVRHADCQVFVPRNTGQLVAGVGVVNRHDQGVGGGARW